MISCAARALRPASASSLSWIGLARRLTASPPGSNPSRLRPRSIAASIAATIAVEPRVEIGFAASAHPRWRASARRSSRWRRRRASTARPRWRTDRASPASAVAALDSSSSRWTKPPPIDSQRSSATVAPAASRAQKASVLGWRGGALTTSKTMSTAGSNAIALRPARRSVLRAATSATRASARSGSTVSGRSPLKPRIVALSVAWPRPVKASEP